MSSKPTSGRPREAKELRAVIHPVVSAKTNQTLNVWLEMVAVTSGAIPLGRLIDRLVEFADAQGFEQATKKGRRPSEATGPLNPATKS